MPRERILFVTGRLAEEALRRVVAEVEGAAGVDSQVAVLGISVAALMHADWVARKLSVPSGIDRVVLPGWCQGDIARLREQFGLPFELGPKDLHDLPEFLTAGSRTPADLSRYDIEIVAEINHAGRLSEARLVALARELAEAGADVIDLGCVPGEHWPGAADAVRLLRGLGLRVSIDSFDRREVESAVAAGAELVFSCNASNRDWAAGLPAELVAIPDEPSDLASLGPTIETLERCQARYRIDPILEPIGFGFAASLARYVKARQLWPSAPMLMGTGNLTELTEADSAGVNLLLVAFCQELGVTSVLTTQVINWCRTAVRELDLARRLVRHAIEQHVLPKHVDSRLLLLRDAKLREPGEELLARLAAAVSDANFRIFAARGELHVINRDGYWHGPDPFEIFDRLPPVDAAHAFYLGFEMAKAVTALTLGKNYTQDEALDWGFLTRPEASALHRRRSAGGSRAGES